MCEEFKFKNFTIRQENCAMKVGTDGVMLGAWANGGKHLLDIGTGTGVIALMMAQRFPDAVVEGIEIDKEAAIQATYNVGESPFSSRITVHATSLQRFRPRDAFDGIVVNPPYFTNSLVAPDMARTVARHVTTLTFAEIFQFAVSWLSAKGELSAVIPVESLDALSSEGFVRGFFLARQYWVKTVESRKAKRVLLSFTKSRPKAFDRREVLLMDGGRKSQWYDDLTKDFYIK